VTDQVFGARTTNVLQRGTVYLGSMFFILALALAILIGKQTKKRSLIEPEKPAAAVESAKDSGDAKTAEAPKEEPKSLADELPVGATPAPVAEEAPAPAAEEAPAPAAEEAPAPAAEETPAAQEEKPADAVEAPAPETVPEPAAPAAEENKADKSE